MSRHKTIRGTLLYTSKQTDRMDAERGREYFTLSTQSDGISVLHAHCEIDDVPDVIRDVTSSFETATMAPIDGFVRLSIGSKFEGCGWFQFDETHACCNSFNVKAGSETVKLKTQTRTTWFGHHAIINDGFLSRFFPLDASPSKIWMKSVMMSSPDHRGATGPTLFPMRFGLVYVGHETITVKAGKFNARKFQITDTAGNLPEEHPPYEMWCTADEDGLFLKGGVGGYMQTYYELVELER